MELASFSRNRTPNPCLNKVLRDKYGNNKINECPDRRAEEPCLNVAKHGRVNILGKDWKYYDIKNLDKHFKKVEGIRDMKRICIEKKQIKKRTEAIVKCFRNFRFENAGESKRINPLKRNTNLLSIKLVEKELGHFIKGAKKKDVESLLTKQFGENWKNDPSLK
ncbi:hypothetical protein ACJJTC_010168 [Scirpophaga incertulas]